MKKPFQSITVVLRINEINHEKNKKNPIFSACQNSNYYHAL